MDDNDVVPFKCNGCGKVPKTFESEPEHRRGYWQVMPCETSGCISQILDIMSVRSWNEAQTVIEAVQEEYFAAGEESSTAYEHGHAYMTCSQYRKKAWKILK